MDSAISGLMVPWPIAWHIPMLGMPRVTPFLPPASSSAAVGVDVASFGDGDDDGDDVRHGEDVAVVDEDGVSSASPLSSWSPPSDMADSWRSLVGLSSPSVWRESTRLGPSVSGLVRRWCSPDSGFRSLRRDPCLHAAFEELSTDSSALLESAFSSMCASCNNALLHHLQFPLILFDITHITKRHPWNNSNTMRFVGISSVL